MATIATDPLRAVEARDAMSGSAAVKIDAGIGKFLIGGIKEQDVIETASPQVKKAKAIVLQDLARLQDKLNEQNTRIINLDRLAGVLNDVRPDLLHSNERCTVPSDRTLVGKITTDQLKDWHAALSVTPDQVKKMESAAYWAGLFIPTSGTVFNMISYLVVPFATQNIKNPWITASIGLGVVGLQPFVTSPVQSLMIGVIDYYRRLGQPEVKLDKGSVNSKASQSEIKKNIEESIASAQASEQGVVALFEQHGIVDDYDLIDPGKLFAALSEHRLSPKDRAELTDACRKHLEALMALCANTSQMNAIDGAHARQIESTLMQIGPRALRAGSGMVAPFVGKPGAQAPHSKIADLTSGKLSPLSVTGVSSGIALIAIVLQHLAAGKDEVNGLRLEQKLNMLHADVFNEGGREAAYQRGKITPQDLSEEKCRKMVVLPEATLVQRVADRLDADLKRLKSHLQEQQLALVGPQAIEEGAATGDPQLRKKIAAYETDLVNLRNLVVTDGLHEDTQVLLKSALNGSLSFAWGEAYAKLTKPLELTSQISQRLGQTLTLGPLGSAGATAGGRMASAALGGSSHISMAVQFYLALASMFIGVFAAATQGMVTNVKNQRRDARPEDAMGFWMQTLKGAGAPVLWGNNLLKSWQGRHEAGVAISQFQKQARRMGKILDRLEKVATADEVAPDNDGNVASRADQQLNLRV